MIERICCALKRQEDLKLLEMAPGGGGTLPRAKVSKWPKELPLQQAGAMLLCDVGRVCCEVERQEDLKLLEMAPGGGDALAKGKVLVPKALDADDEEDAESDDDSDDDEARL